MVTMKVFGIRSVISMVLVSLFVLGCAPNRKDIRAAGPPKVLIIGDSISIGYFEPTRELLQSTAEVHHNPGNAQHTAHGLAHLDEWLGETRWDVIHFNHGLHDLKYVDEEGKRVSPAEGRQQIPIDDYARNLDVLARRLKKSGARLIFATTTPVPEGAKGRIQGDAKRYNQVATAVMVRHGIVVNDLYAYALPRLGEIQRPRDVHFTAEGSRLLAEQVAKSVRAALARRQASGGIRTRAICRDWP
jgi:acyl-CoA thioesterase-1